MDMEKNDSLPRLSRRDVIKWFAAAAAASQVAPFISLAQNAPPAAQGYGTDPKVAGVFKAGDFWPLTLTSAQRKTVTSLADVILPADSLGPAASAVRVPDYIDEWVSAPYPKQKKDRGTILGGLKWIDQESNKRFKKGFANISAKQQTAICDDLCIQNHKDSDLKKAASFFRSFTGLCMGAYYSTQEGWKAIGYIGNVPTATFDGPSQEVLDKLGVTQTVS
jgi:hypothetical protein